MIRICLIGPGNIDFHYHKLLGIKKEKLEQEISKLAESLYSSNVELSLLPDDGISIEIAKSFKQLGGKVIGLAPLSDKEVGVNFLKKYMEEEIQGHKLFDEIIDTGDWPKHDMRMGLFGDAILYLGRSPGTEGERNYAVYMYKIIKGMKHGVSQGIETLHKEARAGKTIPYSIFVYCPFFKSGKLEYEDEEYMKRFGINLIYIKNSRGLEGKLKNSLKKN